jgi:hypothetical protein
VRFRLFRSTPLLRSGGAGLVGQICLSLVSLETVTASARLLGPSGVGSIAIGLTAYLLSEPAIAKTSTGTPEERRTSAGAILTLSTLLGGLGSATMVMLGTANLSDGAVGFLVFAPWIVPALLNDIAKSLLFRDGRSWSGAACDAVWLVCTTLLFVAAVFQPSIWSLGLAWGLGAGAGSASFADISQEMARRLVAARTVARSGISRLCRRHGRNDICDRRNARR